MFSSRHARRDVRPGRGGGFFVLFGLVLAGPACAPGSSTETGPAATTGPADAGTPSGEDGGGSGSTWTCGAPARAVDFCAALPTGTRAGCGGAANGQPPQTGYLDIAMPDGSHLYSCATSCSDGGDGGYLFSARSFRPVGCHRRTADGS